MSKRIATRAGLLARIEETIDALLTLKVGVSIAPKANGYITDCVAPSSALRVSAGDAKTRLAEVERLLK